jgi:hypothetical protein
MKYEDKKRKYSLEVPDTWQGQGRKLSFIATGGKAAFQSPDREANINISVGKLNRPEWFDLAVRRAAMNDFLRKMPSSYGMSDHLEEVKGFALTGETNTLYFLHSGKSGFGRIISSVHNGIEYVVQSKDEQNNYKATIDGILGTFKFGAH